MDQRDEMQDFEGDFYESDRQMIADITGIRNEDVFYCSFKAKVLCPAFYVAYDHEMEAVVIAVRGVLSIKDVATCLVGLPKIVKTIDEGDTSKLMYGHKGMLQGANAIQLNLEQHHVLQKVFQDYPNYRLVICGHSLGGGTASLLAIILKSYYPTVQCYAYSPPGCIIKLSSESLEQFNLKILYLLQISNVPKYRIMMDSMFYLSGCCRYCLSRIKRVKSLTDMLIDKDALLQYPDYDESNVHDVVADAREVLLQDTITGKSRPPPRGRISLYLPGRILHISKGRTIIRCCGLCNERPLQAHWTVQSEFTEIVIDSKTMQSHFVYNDLKQLLSLQKQYKEENEPRQTVNSPLSPLMP